MRTRRRPRRRRVRQSRRRSACCRRCAVVCACSPGDSRSRAYLGYTSDGRCVSSSTPASQWRPPRSMSRSSALRASIVRSLYSRRARARGGSSATGGRTRSRRVILLFFLLFLAVPVVVVAVVAAVVASRAPLCRCSGVPVRPGRGAKPARARAPRNRSGRAHQQGADGETRGGRGRRAADRGSEGARGGGDQPGEQPARHVAKAPSAGVEQRVVAAATERAELHGLAVKLGAVLRTGGAGAEHASDDGGRCGTLAWRRSDGCPSAAVVPTTLPTRYASDRNLTPERRRGAARTRNIDLPAAQ